MSARQLAGVALLGAAGWAVWRLAARGTAGGSLQPPLALSWGSLDSILGTVPDSAIDAGGYEIFDPTPATIDAGSYGALTLAHEDPSGDLLAKNPRSSASGLFQFTKATWQRVGGAWGPDPTKPFGGLTPSLAEQQMRFDRLTSSNAGGLARAGLAATNAALYAAHFLGLPTALRVLTAAPSTSLASLVGSTVIAKNPVLRGMTVANFVSWAGGQG